METPPLMKPSILFVAEAVTLAQVVRLVTLARSLPSERYEVHFASSDFPELVFGETQFLRHEVATLSPSRAARALDAGRRLYEKADLLDYIAAETALFERVRPALVVGDFRLSLSTSAELCGVPSAVLINAYWSPFAERSSWPVPDHPILRVLGEKLTARYFPLALPKVFEHFAAPLDAARAVHGLSKVGSLLEMLTHGDHVLYPDDPWLVPVPELPPHHRFLGPVPWEPSTPLPELDFPDPKRPLVYATLGSSGRVEVLPSVLQALAEMPVNAVVATAGRSELARLPDTVRMFPFVPGDELCRRADVVLSNGGSTTGYQALAAGTPVVGLPSNLDQFLAMQCIERVGAGVMLEARRATAPLVRSAIERVLGDPSARAAAGDVARRFATHDSAAEFVRFVDEQTGYVPPAQSEK